LRSKLLKIRIKRITFEERGRETVRKSSEPLFYVLVNIKKESCNKEHLISGVQA